MDILRFQKCSDPVKAAPMSAYMRKPVFLPGYIDSGTKEIEPRIFENVETE
jgi:hypothetical protein